MKDYREGEMENESQEEYRVRRVSESDWVTIVMINLLIAASVSLARAALDYLFENYRGKRDNPYYSW